jgi:hypothetical protein
VPDAYHGYMPLPKFNWKSGLVWGPPLIVIGLFNFGYLRLTFPIPDYADLEYRQGPVERIDRHERIGTRVPCFCGVVITYDELFDGGKGYYYPEEAAEGDLEDVYKRLQDGKKAVGVRFDPEARWRDDDNLEHVVYEVSVDEKVLKTYADSARGLRKDRNSQSWSGLLLAAIGAYGVAAAVSRRRSGAGPGATDPAAPGGHQ